MPKKLFSVARVIKDHSPLLEDNLSDPHERMSEQAETNEDSDASSGMSNKSPVIAQQPADYNAGRWTDEENERFLKGKVFLFSIINSTLKVRPKLEENRS